MKNTVNIIIPLYKSKLTNLEEISIQQCFKVLSSFKIIAVKPKQLSLEHYNFKFDQVVEFEDHFFKDISGYNKLMLSAEFYERFLNCIFILIYQPDSFVFQDDLIYWCSRGYDYIGAPWLRQVEYPDIIKKTKSQILNYLHIRRNTKHPGSDFPSHLQFENRVGNGGLSLRNTKKFYDICLNKKELIENYNSRPEHYFNEDIFWGIEVNRKKKLLNIPHYKKAVNFSIENSYEHAFRLTKGKLPFGCHGWDRDLIFWAQVFKRVGVEIA